MNPNGWKEIGRQMDGKKKLPMRPMCTIVLGAALHSLLLLVYVICYAMNWIKLLLLLYDCTSNSIIELYP